MGHEPRQGGHRRENDDCLDADRADHPFQDFRLCSANPIWRSAFAAANPICKSVFAAANPVCKSVFVAANPICKSVFVAANPNW